MSGAYEEQLRALVAAVTMDAPDRARVTGVRGDVVEVAVANERGPFLGLADVLYAGHYNVPRSAKPVSDADPAAFAAALSAANAIPARVRNGVAIYRDMVTGPGGHYVVMGRAVHDAATGRQVRFYWNIGADGGELFVREISARFDRLRIPFQAKVPVHPQGYARTDAAVLYLGDDDVDFASDAIAAAYDALLPYLHDEVPMFTLRLARGLAFAESPNTGDSFGMHRCDLIAEGLVRAFERGAADDEARLAAVRERLVEYGFDLERLAFNPLARYPYRFGAIGRDAA